MDITTIDKNFKQKEITNFASNVYTFPSEKFPLFGGWFDEEYGFIKMHPDDAKKIAWGVAWGTRCTAGMRTLFSTNSKSIKLTAKLWQKCLMNHMPLVASAGFTLCEIVGKQERFVGNFVPPLQSEGEEPFVAELKLKGGKMRNYVLYFPLYSGVQSLSIELKKNSTVAPYKKYRDVLPVLYYGSSITQGGCASRADNCYPALISEWSNTDYILHGYSGNAKGEQGIDDFLSNVDCSVFVCDFDYNANTAEELDKVHLNLYKTFRSNPKNKTTPIVFVSKPDGYYDKDTKDRIKVILKTYQYALDHGDKNVYFINGRHFYPASLREHCAVDGCHPTDLGFYFMAKGIYKQLKTLGI